MSGDGWTSVGADNSVYGYTKEKENASLTGILDTSTFELGHEISNNKVQSNLSYPKVNYLKLLDFSKTTEGPDFFLYYLLQ